MLEEYIMPPHQRVAAWLEACPELSEPQAGPTVSVSSELPEYQADFSGFASQGNDIWPALPELQIGHIGPVSLGNDIYPDLPQYQAADPSWFVMLERRRRKRLRRMRKRRRRDEDEGVDGRMHRVKQPKSSPAVPPSQFPPKRRFLDRYLREQRALRANTQRNNQ